MYTSYREFRTAAAAVRLYRRLNILFIFHSFLPIGIMFTETRTRTRKKVGGVWGLGVVKLNLTSPFLPSES